MNGKNYAAFGKSLIASLYQNQEITIYQAAELNLNSNIDETEEEFRAKIALSLREKKEEAIKKLQAKFDEKNCSSQKESNAQKGQ